MKEEVKATIMTKNEHGKDEETIYRIGECRCKTNSESCIELQIYNGHVLKLKLGTETALKIATWAEKTRQYLENVKGSKDE